MIPSNPIAPFNPKNLGAGTLKLWLASQLGVTGSSVTLWRDQSGTSNDFPGAANKPTYTAGGQNGNARLQGTSATTGLQIAPAVANGLIATFMMVASPSSSASRYLMSDVANNTAFITNFGGLGFEWFNGADRYTLSGAGTTGAHILTVTQNGVGAAALKGYLDGTLVFTQNSTVALGNVNTLLNDSALTGGAVADLYECLIWSSVLNANDLADAHTYLKAKYNL